MSEGKIIVGLDIGTTKVACIVGQKAENGKIEILGYGKTISTGVRRGVVTNIFDTVEAIKTAVKQASDQSGVEINRVSVGIAGQHIKSLQHRGVLMRDNHETEITEAELERLRNDTFRQQNRSQLPRHHRADLGGQKHREMHPKRWLGDGLHDS